MEKNSGRSEESARRFGPRKQRLPAGQLVRTYIVTDVALLGKVAEQGVTRKAGRKVFARASAVDWMVAGGGETC